MLPDRLRVLNYPLSSAIAGSLPELVSMMENA